MRRKQGLAEEEFPSSHLGSLVRGCHAVVTCVRTLASVTRRCLVFAWHRRGKGQSIRRFLPPQRRMASTDDKPLCLARGSPPPGQEARFTNPGRYGIGSNVNARRAIGMQVWVVVGEYSNGGSGVADHRWKIRKERPEFMNNKVATAALYYLRGKDLQDTNYNEYLAWFRFAKRVERSRKEGARNDPVPCHCSSLHKLFLVISSRRHKLLSLVYTITTFHKSAGITSPWVAVLLPPGRHRFEPLAGDPSVPKANEND